MVVRLHFIVEGQTEETFVNQTLRPHLARFSVWVKAHCVETGRKGGVKYRGGIVSYQKARKDIGLWMLEDQNADARFTTMFDLYGLPHDFPGYEEAARLQDPYDRVKILEDSLREDTPDSRFIPYIQLHEFESLLLADPQKLDAQFYENSTGIQRLVQLAGGFGSPELIDDGPDSAPSKRIAEEIPEYPRSKASAGPITAERIGLHTLRTKCGHFDAWLSMLESL